MACSSHLTPSMATPRLESLVSPAGAAQSISAGGTGRGLGRWRFQFNRWDSEEERLTRRLWDCVFHGDGVINASGMWQDVDRSPPRFWRVRPLKPV